MRVIVMVQGDGVDEDKATPTEEMFEKMTAYNEELVKAGIMLDGEGLLPTAKGARIEFRGGTTSVVDGPFVESKEIVMGYWIWEVSSLEEAIEWARRCPADPGYEGRSLLEIRPIATPDDFGAEYTDEIRAREEQLAEQLKQRES